MYLGVVTLVSVVQLDQLTHELGIDIASLASSNNNNNEGDQPSGASHLSPVVTEELPQINLSQQDRERLRRAAHILRQRLILRLWLDDHGLMDYAPK